MERTTADYLYPPLDFAGTREAGWKNNLDPHLATPLPTLVHCRISPMASGPALKALFKLNNTPDRATNVKRLALLFDELIYMLPDTHPVLDGEFLEEGRIRVRRSDGAIIEEDFDFFVHTSSGFTFDEASIHDSELEETLAELRENEIARSVAVSDFDELTTEQFRRVRNAFAASDMLDEEFNRLSETTVDQYEGLKISTVRSIDENGTHQEHSLIRAPNAIIDSYDITDVLACAHRATACPVFIDPHHKGELRHRYEKTRTLGDVVLRSFPELEAHSSVRPAFGAVSFSIASQLFDLATISAKSTSEIVKYRKSMADARERYISTDLLELTQLVESSPWGGKAEHEIELYVMGKLRRDTALYRQAMRETWERMFGSLATGITTAVKAAGAGGIVGSLLPQSSAWEMAVIGALAGITKEVPSLARTIVESVLAVRAQRRSGIAYFAEFD
ncbi:MAG: hypothetical protein LAP61_21780 [Acidobacteriia bacterium]|nr:hypothetical protein [Terriglobia bacterium]